MSDKVYGRKIIRMPEGKITDIPDVTKGFLVLLIFFLAGLVIGSIVTGLIVHRMDRKAVEKEKTTISISASEEAEMKPYGSTPGLVDEEGKTFDWSSGEELGFKTLDIPLDEDLQQFTYCLAYCYNIDYSLMLAVMEKESGYEPGLISQTHDYGLMQINRCNHKWLSETLDIGNFLDPKQNIRAGMYIFSELFEKYGDDPSKVLMAYNMGEGNAQVFWKQGITSTDYTKKVFENQKKIKERMGMNDDN